MPSVQINTAQDALNVGMNPAFETLKQALEVAGLFGRYTLRALHNGRAAAPPKVNALHVGPVCKDGIALFFPTPVNPQGLPALLALEKAGTKMLMDPFDVHRKLIDALGEVDDDAIVSHEKVLTSSSPEAPALTGEVARQVRSEERLQALFANVRDMNALHRLLFEAAKDDPRHAISRARVLETVRNSTGLTSLVDLGRFFRHLEEQGIVTTLLPENNKYRNASSVSIRINDPSLAPISVPEPEEITPALASTATQEPISAAIARLVARRDELRPQYEEFVRIESELAAIRNMLS